MKTSVIRKRFLEFFQKHEHEVRDSSSLIPAKDPSLLFTPAGMVPLKEYFLGLEKPSSTRATSIQRCLRVGGKHNDLENVGYTARHHTFFEMLGNFSFGDYFKRQAIAYAWKFLTEELQLPPEKLWVTTYVNDDEAHALWLEQGVDPSRMSRCGEADNFWSMGETGPCGPCTEIFYDHGPEIEGTPPGDDQVGDRYVEIWNLVFMQYNRDAVGVLTDLPKPCVDTGMGLERIAAVMQGVDDNYDIDIFQPLYDKIKHITQAKHLDTVMLKVVADHSRAATFMILDHIHPSNEGRGYVLRRIIRRALRYGYQQGIELPFMYQLVEVVVATMSDAYPDLISSESRISKVVKREEERFAQTLASGMKLLKSNIEGLKELPGSLLFKLYDSYGFPIDLSQDFANESGLTIDLDGFDACMKEQKKRSREAQKFKGLESDHVYPQFETTFTGYEQTKDHSTVCFIAQGGSSVDTLSTGEHGDIIVTHTPFYAESGGQVGDSGLVESSMGVFEVKDTQRYGSSIVHHGVVIQGEINKNDKVDLTVDSSRHAIMMNHTATHLLHAALRQILGDSVVQKGSLVEATRLRFDFSYDQALSTKQLSEVERWVNDRIEQNLATKTQEMPLKEAKKSGVMALFDEKYDDQVRVLSIGDISHELCGGTHMSHTGAIVCFKITTETSIASGIRRIEAVTGYQANQWLNQKYALLQKTAQIYQTSVDQVPTFAEAQRDQLLDLSNHIQKQENRLIKLIASQLLGQLHSVGQCQVILASDLPFGQAKSLRLLMDACQSQLSDNYVMVLISELDLKQQGCVMITTSRSMTQTLTARDLLVLLEQHLSIKGGGKPSLIQGRISGPINQMVWKDAVMRWLESKLENVK